MHTLWMIPSYLNFSVSAHLNCGFNSNETEEDKIIWIFEASGKYSARSAYLIQFSGHCSSCNKKWSGKTRRRHATNSFFGYCCKTKSGQQIGYWYENGPITISVLYALQFTYLLNAHSRELSGCKAACEATTQIWTLPDSWSWSTPSKHKQLVCRNG